jgi:hypothetical protein
VKEEERWFDMWSKPETVYPTQDEMVNPDLPDSVRLTIVEARSCIKTGAYTASALMCRKTLEGICSEHNIQARSLAGALNEMKERGLMKDGSSNGRQSAWSSQSCSHWISKASMDRSKGKACPPIWLPPSPQSIVTLFFWGISMT